MKRYIFMLALVLAVAPVSLARGAGGREVTLKGYVVDRHCASVEGDRLTERAKTMQTSCTLSGGCVKSGLGVVVDGRWYAFDAKGSTKAVKLLEKSKTRKGVMVEVTGAVDGDQIVVSSISEVGGKK